MHNIEIENEKETGALCICTVNRLGRDCHGVETGTAKGGKVRMNLRAWH